MSLREDIVATARGYIGTPFVHQGRVKGVGVDCAGLVICVARDLGLVASGFDINGYGPVPMGYQMRQYLRTHMDEIPKTEIRDGDVLHVLFAGEPQHLAFVAGNNIVHAYSVAGGVVEHRLDSKWAARVALAFRFRQLKSIS